MSDVFELVRFFVIVFLVIAAIGLGFYGLEAWVVQRIGAQWRAQKRTIHYGPVRSGCTSLRPRSSNSHGMVSGTVGIVDEQLVFKGLTGRLYDVAIPLNQVRGVGLRLIFKRTQPAPNRYQVQVDFEAPGGWQVYRLGPRNPREFAGRLSALAHLPLLEYDGTAPYTLTLPVATRLHQDIYGKWEADFTDQFYIGPDRVLFGWQNAILFTGITEITFYDRTNLLDGVLGAFNPVSPQDVLRIDYTGDDGTAQVIGFQLPNARQWCDLIVARSGVPLTVYAGRKKQAGGG